MNMLRIKYVYEKGFTKTSLSTISYLITAIVSFS